MFWIFYNLINRFLSLYFTLNGVRKKKNVLTNLQNFDAWRKDNLTEKLIQIHCASLGEFELSLPLVSALKKRNSEVCFLFTFFSNSGYENAQIPKDSYKLYLPIDIKSRSQKFIKKYKPDLCVFIKYEFWFNYLFELDCHQIPFGFFNVSLQKAPRYLTFQIPKALIEKSSFFYTTNEKTDNQFIDFNFTKFDRILDQRYLKAKANFQVETTFDESLKKFLSRDKIIICGSIWEEDFELISPILKENKELNWILAPHNLSPKFLNQIQNELKEIKVEKFSKLKDESDFKVLIVDTIGKLKYLYPYAKLNYIGGGFKTGLHNVIEPVPNQRLIVFGPKYQGDPEAGYLISNGLAKSVAHTAEFREIIQGNMNQKNLELDLIREGEGQLLKIVKNLEALI